MLQLFPDLWQSAAEHPFDNALTTHAYLWTQTAGNVLIYSTGQSDEYEHMQKLGGLTHQYLSHRDEAGPPLRQIRALFGSALCCHQLEAAAVRAACPVDELFTIREKRQEHIEIIPTPGHTDGSTCFLVHSPCGQHYLFTGDTIMPRPGDAWGTFILADAGGNVRDLQASLHLLRDLEPDVVFSSASVGPFSYQTMTPGAWPRIIDQALTDLQ